MRYLVGRNAELEARVDQRTKDLRKAMKTAQAAQEALREQATKDGLTKLLNRRAIFEILDREIERSLRENSLICILMADLDDFKQINDNHGHQVGDRVLQEVARRITSLKRPYDSMGRYEGEKFLVALPGCTPEDAIERAEEFRTAVADRTISYGLLSLAVTCSFGVAEHSASQAARIWSRLLIGLSIQRS